MGLDVVYPEPLRDKEKTELQWQKKKEMPGNMWQAWDTLASRAAGLLPLLRPRPVEGAWWGAGEGGTMTFYGPF